MLEEECLVALWYFHVRAMSRFGDGGNPEMQRAIRAHGNNTEYVPIALILLVLAHDLGAGLLLIHAIGLTLTIGRMLHGIGFVERRHETPTGHSTLRRWGMILTLLAILTGIFGCLWLLATAPA